MRAHKPNRGRELLDWDHYNYGGGINIQDSPQMLDDADLTQAVNVYLQNDGGISMRRGMTTYGPLVTPGAAKGVFRFYQEIISGAPGTNVVTVMQVGDDLYNAATGAAISTGSALGVGSAPMSCLRVFDPNHNGGTDIMVICTGVGGPYAYDGTTVYALPSGPTTITGARWCELVSNVLWFGGIPSQPNLLVGSALGTPESQPGYATFAMSYPITGLGTLGVGLQTNLVVGMAQGLTLIFGFTPNSYIEQQIPNEDGVQSGLSMITINGILYFVGNYAIYQYDGSNFTEISRKVRPWILNDPLFQNGFPMNGNRQSSWAMYWNQRIYFWFSSNNASGPVNAGLVYDLARQGWTAYSGVTLSGGTTLNAPSDPDPATCVVCDSVTGQAYNFDVFADSNFNVTDNGTNISANFLSKFFKIGEPGTTKHLLRVELEMFFLTEFSGLLQVVTDYGISAATSVLLLQNTSPPQWDVAQWDVAEWAGTDLSYVNQRIDTNLSGEAFAFGLMSPNPG